MAKWDARRHALPNFSTRRFNIKRQGRFSQKRPELSDQSNRFSQSSALGNSENVSARKPRFEATSAPNPFMVGGVPTIAIFGFPDNPFNQCRASASPNSYRSKLDSSPLSDKQSTRTLSKPP